MYSCAVWLYVKANPDCVFRRAVKRATGNKNMASMDGDTDDPWGLLSKHENPTMPITWDPTFIFDLCANVATYLKDMQKLYACAQLRVRIIFPESTFFISAYAIRFSISSSRSRCSLAVGGCVMLSFAICTCRHSRKSSDLLRIPAQIQKSCGWYIYIYAVKKMHW